MDGAGRAAPNLENGTVQHENRGFTDGRFPNSGLAP